MAENIIQDYIVNYIPAFIGKNLAENPIPEMGDTDFSLQITIEGEKSLTFGITIKNAQEITVTPGEIQNPMVSMKLPEDIINPLVKLVSSFVSRRQYDIVKGAKGSMDVEIDMPGDWKLPIKTTFNGAAEPYFKLTASLKDMSEMAMGDIDPTRAFMQGKLKIFGDITFALALSQLNLKK
ncbi:MAG: SCP2 sterol-binding domain-containing protein [Spirochaetes bacterium]|nr:SCP2 sterol-binding domain-containing protein [Spirochaetota bacterium]